MEVVKEKGSSNTGKVLATVCIISILFLSSFDAKSVDGVVPLIQTNFNVNDAQVAMIRTASSVANTASLACTWLIGDLFRTSKLFLVSASIWITLSLLSVVLGTKTFWIFVGFRSLASGATAAFGVLAPVILAHIFEDRSLGIALMFASAADMFSSTITGIISSWIVSNGIPWQSGLVVGPVMAVFPIIGLLCARDKFQRSTGVNRKRSIGRSFVNAFGIFSIKSYVLLNVGMALGLFNLISMIFWSPTMILQAWTAYPESFLGLSYTLVMSLYSLAQTTGSLIGLPAFLWFAQSWRYGTGVFSCRDGNTRAYPIVICGGASMSALLYILGIFLLDTNFIIYLVVTFIWSVSTSAETSLSQLIILMVVPSSSRAAAIALSRLTAGIITIPAAQLVGVISDTFRGNSVVASDRFLAYQLALLITASFAIASAICEFSMIFFFASDCAKAEEKDREEEVENETTPMIGKLRSTKNRSQSLLDAVIRSRAATMNSIYG